MEQVERNAETDCNAQIMSQAYNAKKPGNWEWFKKKVRNEGKLFDWTFERLQEAANGQQIRDFGETTGPFKTNDGSQKCISFKSATVVKTFISMLKVVRSGNTAVLDEKNPHIRNTRDGTMIKLDVNSGVYTMDMWMRSNRCPQANKARSIV